MPDLEVLQRQAEAEGLECIVAAVIVDEEARVFTPRRCATNPTLPGLWDLVGGHVEHGETLIVGLHREVLEETGWQIRGCPPLVFTCDWELTVDGRRHRHREFDFLVELKGELRAPQLRPGEHDDFRWIPSADLSLLDANHGRDGGLVRRAIEAALRHVAGDESM